MDHRRRQTRSVLIRGVPRSHRAPATKRQRRASRANERHAKSYRTDYRVRVDPETRAVVVRMKAVAYRLAPWAGEAGRTVLVEPTSPRELFQPGRARSATQTKRVLAHQSEKRL